MDVSLKGCCGAVNFPEARFGLFDVGGLYREGFVPKLHLGHLYWLRPSVY